MEIFWTMLASQDRKRIREYIAEQNLMATRALSLELDELRVLKTPCILHRDFSHFVVLVSVKRNRYVLHDPARGIRHLSREEMSRYWGLKSNGTKTYDSEVTGARLEFGK